MGRAMVIRTGILHVPAIDEEAGAAVRLLLQTETPEAVVLVESYAADQRNWVADVLRRWCDEEELDLVLTVGGTMPAPGPSGRQIVPDAAAEVAERSLPGLGEAMRAYAQETTDLALIDRSAAVIRGRTLILNLPDGAGPATLFLEAVTGVIASVCAHLQESPYAPRLDEALAEDEEQGVVGEEMTGGKLDADEFAAFLRRGREDDPPLSPA